MPHVTCDMPQEIFEAKQKQGSWFKINVKQRVFQQLNKVKLSRERKEFNWLKAACLICCGFLRVGEMLQSTLTQLSVANSLTKVHSPSEGRQAQLNA